MSDNVVYDTQRIKEHGLDRLEELCGYLLPGGRKEGSHWKVGSLNGEPGKSFDVNLKTGQFGDWADGAKMQAGPINLWMQVRGVDFNTARSQLAQWLGISVLDTSTPKQTGSFDWSECVNAMASSDKLRELETWRGFTREFCAWLCAKKLLGLHHGCYAFPVCKNGSITGAHFLETPPKGWKYSPGTSAAALVIGNIKEAVEVHIHESTWDGHAFCDRAEAYRTENVCVIVTRGAGNAKTVRGIIPAGKRIYVWPQNDKPDLKTGKIASEEWFKAVKENLGGAFYRVQTPKEFEDLNAWTKEGASKSDLLDAIDVGQLVGEPPRIYIEFLKPSQIRAYKTPPDLVLIGDSHIVRGSVTVIAGPPGVGKSRSNMALAEAGATKLEWFGYKVHCNFRTLVIQNENGLCRLQKELDDINEPRLEQYLRVCPPPPYGMCFWREEFRDQLKSFAEEFGPHAVVLDPWNAVARDDRAKDYLETFDIIREVFPQGEKGPSIVIDAHTRKPTQGERANGRELLNLLAGSYVLGSVPRVVFVMQHASDDVAEERVVLTCCKNNDGELGKRSVWTRQNGLFAPVENFDWTAWDQGEKEGVFTLEQVAEILEKNPKGLRQADLAREIVKRGVSRATAYRRIDEAEKSGLIKFQKGSGVYVVPE